METTKRKNVCINILLYGVFILYILLLFVSVAVEIIQFTFKFGIGDIDDVILTVIGGLIGCIVCRLVYLICKDDYKTQRFIAFFAPAAGVISFVILILYNR